MKYYIKTINLLIVMIFPLLTLALHAEKTSALSGSNFDAGRIIDDGVFFNTNSLSATEIQQFLNAKVPTCDTNGSKQYKGTTRAQYGASRGYPAPYTCLKNYHQSIPTIINGSDDLCKGSVYAGYKSAAQIIFDVSQACQINPKVFLVLLQKEQSLITDEWPWGIQYRSATGYGCPDTAPCDSEFYGFFNQVYQAAKAYKRYQANPANYNYRAGRNNTILWHPNRGCGESNVYINNQATAGLYIYTPYRPNQEALNNLYGAGDGCSSYGNRNFWRIYNDWFGSTYGDGFMPLITPRWMQVKNDGTQKVYVFTGDSAGDALMSGRQIRFVDKILINNRWYLRSEFNHNSGDSYAIAQDQLEEIPYQSISPKWVTLTSNGNRSYPAARTSVGAMLLRGTSIKVVDQITVDGNVYYRTEVDKNNGQSVGIHSRFLANFAPITLDSPRNFCTNKSVRKVTPTTGVVGPEQPKGTLFIVKKTMINSIWYYQADIDSGTLLFFNSSDLRNVCYAPFENPRSMRMNRDVARFNPYTQEKYDTLKKDVVVAFSSKILIGEIWYYRTANNTLSEFDAVVPASAVSEL